MIIVKLHGGIGNQMFQYTFGQGAAAKTGQQVKFDLSGLIPLEGVTKRKFRLDVFNIDIVKATDIDIRSFTQEKRRVNLATIKRVLGFEIPRYIREVSHSFQPEILNVASDTYFDGYWQSEKYFIHNKDKVRKAFSLRSPLGLAAKTMAKIINDSSISLHIRRGDYVTNKKIASVLGACNMEYYQDALAKATEGFSEPEIFAFSDDIEWVKENIKTKHKITFVSEHRLEDWEELALMSKCRRHIISNSTFSWWGAWLDPRKNKMVIAPSVPWFKDPQLENKDIMPPSWIQI